MKAELYRSFRRALRTAIGVVILINLALWLGPNSPAAHRRTPALTVAPTAPTTPACPATP